MKDFSRKPLGASCAVDLGAQDALPALRRRVGGPTILPRRGFTLRLPAALLVRIGGHGQRGEREPLTGETEMGWEGCLSVPGLIGSVPRFTRIRYRGVGPDGGVIDRTAEGFHARVVQHECDHLDGILYPQRMTDLSLLMFRDQMRYQPGAGAHGEDRGEDLGEEADEEVA